MRELISFISRKFRSKFVNHIIVGSRSIFSRTNQQVSKMNKIIINVRDSENLLYQVNHAWTHMLTKTDPRFWLVWSLLWSATKYLNDLLHYVCLLLCGLSAHEEIICRKEEWIGGEYDPSIIPAKQLVDRASCRAIDNSFMARTKR
jgi:hypothetical protein